MDCTRCLYEVACDLNGRMSGNNNPLKYDKECPIFKDKSLYTELPCKVGDTVYVICNKEVQETTVFSMKAETEDNRWVFFIQAKAVDGTNKTYDGYVPVFKMFIFGKSVFLTKEEAEAKLKELKENAT